MGEPGVDNWIKDQYSICMEKEQIQTLFLKQQLIVILIYGDANWTSSRWLDLWEDLLWANWQQCREQGVTLRQWLRALRSLDPKYIGADWMVAVPRQPRFFGGDVS